MGISHAYGRKITLEEYKYGVATLAGGDVFLIMHACFNMHFRPKLAGRMGMGSNYETSLTYKPIYKQAVM